MSNKSKFYIDKDKTKRWYLNNKLHRDDGPAVEWSNGDKAWWVNGYRHRNDGPALMYLSGSKYWYLNGKQYSSKEEWIKALTPEQLYNYLWNLDE